MHPFTKWQLRSFLGFMEYYSCFIPGFTTLTSPLTDALQKATPSRVRWAPCKQWAFKQLHNSLQGEPVLHNPDFTQPLIVQTDVSDTRIGAALSQEVKGEDRPILFISCKLQPAEQTYSMVEKEALAVKCVVGTLQYYLTGATFTLVVDRAPLLWIISMNDHNPRVLLWYMSLLPFHFTVCQQVGKDHHMADYLSQLLGDNLTAAGGVRRTPVGSRRAAHRPTLQHPVPPKTPSRTL